MCSCQGCGKVESGVDRLLVQGFLWYGETVWGPDDCDCYTIFGVSWHLFLHHFGDSEF